MIKPVFSQGKVQELKEILKQFSNLEFEMLIQRELAMPLKTCCQDASYLRPNSPTMHKQFLYITSDFQSKAKQLLEIKESHLLRQGLKA